MLLDTKEWHYDRCKGWIVACVRGRDRPGRVIKSILTSVSKGQIDREAIPRMLAEVESESVRPFLRPSWNQPERQELFQSFKDGLAKALRQAAA